MSVDTVLFVIVAASSALLSVMMVVSREIVHSAFYFAGVLIGISLIFFLMGAFYVGIIQILIYVGAVVVLILFGIMLTRRNILLG
ncbi:MAG: NADH-quinone oxidoreductase subunit J [Thermoplasmata archaeon]|uniref:NADH-quinone oxidoreductase subunit J n=1 Tax=Candidatus Sysuiplasma superficiale TaxID=2823368 RepID=A0A8J7YM74_9ARCH|nr:NADH-quinone oxidoreductase subunit J [Candidatus Sysuiplasma superficiale]MBX8644906.1 NADH-quinone oxidoreductase subunit J [Candidatus Sysuiplasma superficiale]